MTGYEMTDARRENRLRVYSSLRKSPSIFASPSEVLSATLPAKPSHTTTSVVPL